MNRLNVCEVEAGTGGGKSVARRNEKWKYEMSPRDNEYIYCFS